MNYRNKANWTLGLVFIAFVCSVVSRHFYGRYFVTQLVYFVMEAALVGGIADWFAVTALFKKPLGFSYHTALIPRNRAKIIDGVAQMVERDLLGIDSLRQKISEVSYSQLTITWFEAHPQAQDTLVGFAATYLQNKLITLDLTPITGKLALWLRERLQKVDMTHQFQRLGLWAMQHQADARLLALALTEFKTLAEQPDTKQKILQFMEEQKKAQTKDSHLKALMASILESTDSLNLDDAAESLHQQLLETLTELENPEHPVRLKFREMLEDSLTEIETKAELRQAISDWQEDVLQRLPFEAGLPNLLQSLIAAATTVPTYPEEAESLLIKWVHQQVATLWNNFKTDSKLQNQFDQYVSGIVLRLVESEHYLIGDMVRETLQSFSDVDLSNFVDAKAGNDLQWIRINGSIVGGMVGLLLFLLSQLVFNPLILPIVHHLPLLGPHIF